ncbi:enoyl-CoA hydratase/isomerase family protein [Rhizobium sp. TRM96647]|uniref:enoyl-CoA hydratase/isomerase family protein n=1 Tax=unclassified Rhizobium TaxID=2613769 RepID=UPI0021E7515C|nr:MULTISPECIES: enoyl-CoA hydratase/isomerase family protein [unclassified Rhizobium]MCV3738841.1 enoyl-CoA hydratase/isomerase family protein [Rhizobium sp. TRM96647]MCV3760452.1 enoyl-CoA hydratase/isomerase family protein [Rhizobium sp. TRM96650]
MTDDIVFTIDGHVATITLNRPQKLNSVTPEMSDAIVEAVKTVNASDTIRCVIVTGAGDRAFCAGSDIKELDGYETPWQFRNRPDYCDAMRRLLKPTIAAVNGYAFGGGLETAMSCDIRIASENAQFAAPEIKLGWIGGGGMATFLAHSIGASNAALMLMTGDAVSADKALAWGLVSEVVPQAALTARARGIAETIASRAPIAAETAKLNLRAAHAMPQEKAIEYERDLQTICFATADALEGRAAFKEKRAPVFHRR